MNLGRFRLVKKFNIGSRFSFGCVQNTVDLIDAKCCFLKPTMTNWKKEHDLDDFINSRLDKKKENANYQVV